MDDFEAPALTPPIDSMDFRGDVARNKLDRDGDGVGSGNIPPDEYFSSGARLDDFEAPALTPMINSMDFRGDVARNELDRDRWR